jgi:hypothetical protein
VVGVEEVGGHRHRHALEVSFRPSARWQGLGCMTIPEYLPNISLRQEKEAMRVIWDWFRRDLGLDGLHIGDNDKICTQYR